MDITLKILKYPYVKIATVRAIATMPVLCKKLTAFGMSSFFLTFFPIHIIRSMISRNAAKCKRTKNQVPFNATAGVKINTVPTIAAMFFLDFFISPLQKSTAL